MAKIALVNGSLRSPQVGSSVTSWVHDVLKSKTPSGVEIEAIAIKDFNLPVFDEAVMPASVSATTPFEHEHSKKWSAAIASYQGYIFVVPEYNGSLAGGTKNAIDYLYTEWPGKPIAVISYGVQGGARANEHFSWLLEFIMKLKVVETKVKLPFAPAEIGHSVSGTLGEQTQKDWAESGKKEEVLKALEEIAAILSVTEK
ncbi:putative NAD(P)H-dependent FMN reductase LOT6 [Stachybotrys elegans]|uniref:NAD(P)H-dependent FMN reductase LOT6 n=1 Tax=Stachybotrys elegans TaxID=80388 RepID=A0A8K0SYP2_9HYPO|nr:putative NAD(P)H-dependent FMN reductase LOT6 [Stachybotrys elegans]